jgi:hypothetical protein
MGRKYTARTDGNQSEIVSEYRKHGVTVVPTHMVGNGFVDIVIGYHGHNGLVEIKDPTQPPSKRKLTPDEQEFHNLWGGVLRIIETVEDVREHVEEIKELYKI